ncbi:MAG: pilus (MSHA type) biogenesis protein MshL, partial [Pseudomonadota bacterium]|nr:pilus (MSHA type) biogenesis protein MshL [Pseudomonadota bacterium]
AGATAGGTAAGAAGSSGSGTPAPAAAPAAGAAAAGEAVLVIANPEAGVVSVRATSVQHERVQEFLDRVMGAARRQVMIEATVVEVTLNDTYKAGIDWTRLATGPLSLAAGDFAQNAAVNTSTTNPGNGGLAVRYANGGVGAAINLLDTFGNTRVLSSPKLMALNNQTALLKVVDNLVYFNISSQFVPATNTTAAYAVTTATPRSVSVGLIMAVTPQISEGGTVSLIVRPTISRVLSYVADPSTTQNATTVANLVPQIQVREMESILSVQSGQVAVLGGLMQQSQARTTNGVPGLGQLPAVGDLFNQRNDSSGKTELVVFLRPLVVDRLQPLPADARESFPGADFFQSPPPTSPPPLTPVPLEDRRS